MEKTDQQLIEEYLAGEANGLEEVIKRYTKPVYSFVYRLSADKEEAVDVLQEVFVKVWKNLSKYDSSKSFKTWLYTIARRTAIDHLRMHRSSRFSEMGDSEEGIDFSANLADPLPLPEEIFAQKELGKFLEKELSKISLTDRTIILLHHEDDMTFSEIAEILDQSVNTVKSRYRRALAFLRGEILKLPDAPN